MSGGLRIALISPKGPLYRRRGGIFGQTLRYMPLTLPTLTALVPKEISADVRCLDEGIEDIPPDLDADLVGLTTITGTAPRAYELADAFRARGIPVVLGGPHVTLAPEDAQPHADSIVTGYAEEEWPRLLRDFVRGDLKKRYDQSPTLELDGTPFVDRSVLPRWKYLTPHVFEATRACVHGCEFCVVPSAWGRKPLKKPVETVVEDLRRMKTRRAIFLDLNLISDREYAKRLFQALTPLHIQWFGLTKTRLCDDLPLLDLAAESGCRGLLMGLESIRADNLRSLHKGFNRPEDYARLVERLHERRIALQGCFVFGLDDDYRYNMIPFKPKSMSPEELAARCVEARESFYSWKSIFSRLGKRVNHRDPWMGVNFLAINAMHQVDVVGRNGLPLGDETWSGPLIPA